MRPDTAGPTGLRHWGCGVTGFRVFRAVLRLLVTGLLLTSAAHAEQALPQWGAALSSGSPRLALYSLVTRRPPGALQTVHALANGQGLTFPASGGTPRRIGGGVSAFPVLGFDRNINGGIPSDTIIIIGLPFTINPDAQAKAGVVAGAGLGANISYAVARGTVLTASAQASRVWSPEHHLGRSDASASLCAGRFIEGWTFIDLCGGALYQTRDLSATNERSLSLRVSKLYSLGASDQELGLRLTRADRRTYRKATYDLDWRGAFDGVGTVSLRLGFGEEEIGFQSLRDQAEIGLTRPVLGKPTTLTAGVVRENGSSLFGIPREDRTVTLALRRPLSDRISARIGLTRTRSTISAFDDQGVTLDFDFGGFRF
jgi:hypothetical protein